MQRLPHLHVFHVHFVLLFLYQLHFRLLRLLFLAILDRRRLFGHIGHWGWFGQPSLVDEKLLLDFRVSETQIRLAFRLLNWQCVCDFTLGGLEYGLRLDRCAVLIGLELFRVDGEDLLQVGVLQKLVVRALRLNLA